MNPYLKSSYAFCVKHISELVLCICLFFSFYQQTIDNSCQKIIVGDGLGYYSYLPAVFIYNDYAFSFTKSISEKHNKMNFGDGFMRETGDGKVNKYYVGLSILWLPFFLLAHLLEILFGSTPDGYAQIYQISVLIAANFYVWLGCKYLRKLILSYSISESAAAFILVLTLFGTNLFFYTTFHASYTHAYSFAIIAVFLYSLDSFLKNENIKLLYFSAFLLGIIVLLRPTNIVIAIMFLFFAGSFSRFFEVLKRFAGPMLISCVIFLLTLFPQAILYFLQSGHFMVWSYDGETFNFDNPEVFKVLFSYQKGLFIYTPLALLALAGLFPLFKKNKFQFGVMIVFLTLSTYIISSWWCWYYGASLGQRVFVDYYAVLALLFSFLYLSFKKNYHKWIFFSATPLLVIYSLILSYQYTHNIIDIVGMNQQKFWFTFLRTDKNIAGLAASEGLFADIGFAHIINIKTSANKYLCSERDESSHILANRDVASGWEAFNMVLLDDNKIAIRSDDGNYVCARLDQEGLLTHGAKEIKAWETFEKIQLENGDCILKSSNGKFVTLIGDKLYANSDNMSNAEHFLFINK